MKINDVKALGENVVCELIEEKITDKKLPSGLVLPAGAQDFKNKINVDGQQKPAYLIVYDIGPMVPKDAGIEKGKECACNMYDAARVFGDNRMFMVFNYKSIIAVVDAERE